MSIGDAVGADRIAFAFMDEYLSAARDNLPSRVSA